VLELGVGTGRLLSRVDADFCTGIDVSAAMLGQAARKGLRVVRADAHRLPFRSGTFDAVIAAGAVFRYLDTAAALQEAARVVVAGGKLAIHQLGARTWTIRGRRTADPRVRELGSVDELVTPARDAGFAVDRIVRWRTLRWFPYLFEIPPWVDGASPVQLWSHVVVVMRRA
jgi:ubiquinone/menaquinone biosynthesis C-methylase UbiE